MKKTLALTFLSIILSLTTNVYVSFADDDGEYTKVPDNFDSYALSCDTWDNYKGNSKRAALEKFYISEKLDTGVRMYYPNNTKQNDSFPCVETETGLKCEGYAYQINSNQTIDDITEKQKFKLTVELDYSKYLHGGGYLLGVGKAGWKSAKLYCDLKTPWKQD